MMNGQTIGIGNALERKCPRFVQVQGNQDGICDFDTNCWWKSRESIGRPSGLFSCSFRIDSQSPSVDLSKVDISQVQVWSHSIHKFVSRIYGFWPLPPVLIVCQSTRMASFLSFEAVQGQQLPGKPEGHRKTPENSATFSLASPVMPQNSITALSSLYHILRVNEVDEKTKKSFHVSRWVSLFRKLA